MTAPSGWYPDPAGGPHYRYWNGQTWSSGTSPSAAAPPPAPGDPGPTRDLRVESQPSRRGWSRAWLLGAAAVLVALVLVGALLLRPGRGLLGGDPDPGTPTPAQPCPEAVVPTATPPPQTGNRVQSGKLSYARLPSPFSPPTFDYRVPFGRDVQSQDATVETREDGADRWVAGVLVARLLAGDGFFGPEQGAQLVTSCILGKFYWDALIERDDRRNAATTIDGRPAWIIESHLSFDIPDLRTKGETLIVVVVDTGAGEAGLWYGSNPDTSPQFDRPIRDSLRSLRVED